MRKLLVWLLALANQLEMTRSFTQQSLRLGYHARRELLVNLVNIDFLLGLGHLGRLLLGVCDFGRLALGGLLEYSLCHFLFVFGLFLWSALVCMCKKAQISGYDGAWRKSDGGWQPGNFGGLWCLFFSAVAGVPNVTTQC